jgi:hypothetical protein
MKQARVETKQRWAARLARRRTRTAHPVPKQKRRRATREARQLLASPTAARDIVYGLLGQTGEIQRRLA